MNSMEAKRMFEADFCAAFPGHGQNSLKVHVVGPAKGKYISQNTRAMFKLWEVQNKRVTEEMNDFIAYVLT